MGARVSELVARNRERTIKLMWNKLLINQQMTLRIHCKHLVEGDRGELYTTQLHRRGKAVQGYILLRRHPLLDGQCRIVNCVRLNARL
jgi:hypothetical protein